MGNLVVIVVTLFLMFGVMGVLAYFLLIKEDESSPSEKLLEEQLLKTQTAKQELEEQKAKEDLKNIGKKPATSISKPKGNTSASSNTSNTSSSSKEEQPEKEEVWGDDYTTSAAGGSGGGSVSITCQTGSYVTEIYGSAGAYVDAIGMKCNDESDLGRHGGNGGGAFTIKNKDGFDSIDARAGSFVDRIAPKYKDREIGSAGGSGGGPVTLACRARGKIVGANIRAGEYVDQIQPICRELR